MLIFKKIINIYLYSTFLFVIFITNLFLFFICSLFKNTSRYLFSGKRFLTNSRYYNSIENNNSQLNPWFVTGFSDGESCFNILVTKSSSNSIGWQVQSRYIIEVNIKDIDLLYKIQTFFGGIGSITSTKKVARFSVFGIKDITNVITHFNNYPLQSAKQIDFALWKKCINLMLSKKHLTQKGLEQIVSYKTAMNFGKSNKLKLSFPNVIIMKRPLVKINDIPLNPSWVTGFVEAEGSFYINNKMRPGFSIGLNDREKFLLIKLNKFFEEIGSVYETPNHNFAEWKVFKLTSFNSLITHFNNYPLKGFKFYNFYIWYEIVKLLENKKQLTPDDIYKIRALKDKLNKWE